MMISIFIFKKNEPCQGGRCDARSAQYKQKPFGHHSGIPSTATHPPRRGKKQTGT